MSPLLPLTLRDVLWLQADEDMEQTQELEVKKSELKIKRDRISLLVKILCDLRHIQLSRMYFKTDVAFKDFLTTLPSYDGDAGKDREERRWKVKQRKPGEIPEWKKKRLAELSGENDKK